jgi:hypothetical protein
MKEKLLKLIRGLFFSYECEPSEFMGHWLVASVPAAIIFQVVWFFYGYYFEMPINKLSPMNALFESIWYGFGGIIIYHLIFSIAAMLITAILHGKPHRIVMLIIGFIGMFFAYHRMVL